MVEPGPESGSWDIFLLTPRPSISDGKGQANLSSPITYIYEADYHHLKRKTGLHAFLAVIHLGVGGVAMENAEMVVTKGSFSSLSLFGEANRCLDCQCCQRQR